MFSALQKQRHQDVKVVILMAVIESNLGHLNDLH